MVQKADLRVTTRIEWKKRKEILKAVYEEPKVPGDDDEAADDNIDVDKLYTEHVDELIKIEREKKGAAALDLFEHDVNMRSHRLVAGLYCLDYVEQPMQEVKIGHRSYLRTIPLPAKLKKKPFYQRFIPPPVPQPGVRRLPEEIEAEIRQTEENQEKLGAATLQLSENVFWFEPPIVCRFETREETLESDPDFLHYLGELEKKSKVAADENDKQLGQSRNKKVTVVEDFDVFDIPSSVNLRFLVMNFIMPKLPDNFGIQIKKDNQITGKAKRQSHHGDERHPAPRKQIYTISSTGATIKDVIYETNSHPAELFPPWSGANRKWLKIVGMG
jgi:cancer susceptibility candidate protein 1